jgi:hypothetical protein
MIHTRATNGYTVAVKKPETRIIMRIDVAACVPDAIETTRKQFGATHNSVFSRVVLWFCEQDEETQAEILNLLPKDAGIDPTRRLLERMARKPGR